MTGLDILGAAPTRAIVIRVRNPLELAQAKGPTGTSLATLVIPETIEASVYDGMVQQMKEQFAKEGVKADVSVVDAGTVSALPAPRGPGEFRALGIGAAVGAVLGFIGCALLSRRSK